jgi:murein DD-endopeptidase MepM/ murein hydrolase activator NlpD
MKSSKIVRSLLSAILFLAILLGSAPASGRVQAAEPPFTYKSLSTGREPSLAIAPDPTHFPARVAIAICYLVDPLTSTTYDVRVATPVDGTSPVTAAWQSSTVETLPLNFGCNTPSLQIDTQGTLHLAYMSNNGSTTLIKYAVKTRSASAWTVQIVDSSTSVAYATPSLALAPDNTPRIAYSDLTNKDLKYAAYTGGAWHLQTLDSTGAVGETPSMAISPSGVEHIVYRDRTSGGAAQPNFKHAWFSSGAWQIESFDPDNDPAQYGDTPKAQVLANESLHVAYFFRGLCGVTLCASVRYAQKSGGTWADEEVVHFVNFSGSISDLTLGVSPDGIPSIGFLYWGGSAYSESALYLYTKQTLTTWGSTVLEQNYHMTTLVIDAKSDSHLAAYMCSYQYCSYQYGYKEKLYPVTGQAAYRNGTAVAGATIKSGAVSATTDASGNFTLNLPKGKATLTASKTGVQFEVGAATITLPPLQASDIHFIASSDYAAVPAAFLDLPFQYAGTRSDMERILKDANPKNPGGRVNSWFDHQYPTGSQSTTISVVTAYNGISAGLQNYKYLYHNGIDFKKTSDVLGEGNPDTILPAGEGTVEKIVRNTDGSGFGNYVILKHTLSTNPYQVYFTLYAHLNLINPALDGYKIAGTKVTRSDPADGLGKMGNSGFSVGTSGSNGKHLHFGVYRDNGNGTWDGFSGADKVVDPFGWDPVIPGSEDPYVRDLHGPSSGSGLWLNLNDGQTTIPGGAGGQAQDDGGVCRVDIPAGFFTGSGTIDLQGIAGPYPADFWASLGTTFRISLLNGFQNTPVQPSALSATAIGALAPTAKVPASDPGPQFTVTLSYDPSQLAHLDENGLAIRQWDENAQAWTSLVSTLDTTAHTVSAATATFGMVDLQAPRLCPADALEGNDTALMASSLDLAAGLANQGFDTPTDEDWYAFLAVGGQSVTLQAYDLAAGVQPLMEIRDGTDHQVLASGSTSTGWTPAADGVYYLRVYRSSGGATGCQALYSLRAKQSYSVYLPVLQR